MQSFLSRKAEKKCIFVSNFVNQLVCNNETVLS